MFILMFCFGACILALSLGPANNACLAQRTTPQNGSQQCAEIPILQCFLNINQNFPPKWALKKTITFHKVQNQIGVLDMVFLENLKNIDVHQTHNLNNEKNKDKNIFVKGRISKKIK